ncbi:hypothetical protein Tco_1308459 [Tanacetum coccineum]
MTKVVWWSRRCCWRQCNSGGGVPRWRQRWCSGDVAAAVTGDGGESGMVVEMKTKCDVEVVVVRWRWYSGSGRSGLDLSLLYHFCGSPENSPERFSGGGWPEKVAAGRREGWPDNWGRWRRERGL